MFPFNNFNRARKKFKPLFIAIQKFFTAYTLESALLVISQYKRCTTILTTQESTYVGLDRFIVEVYLVPDFYDPLHVQKPTSTQLNTELDGRAYLRHRVITHAMHQELIRKYCSPTYLVHFLNKYSYNILEDEYDPEWTPLTYQGGRWVEA